MVQGKADRANGQRVQATDCSFDFKENLSDDGWKLQKKNCKKEKEKMRIELQKPIRSLTETMNFFGLNNLTEETNAPFVTEVEYEDQAKKISNGKTKIKWDYEIQTGKSKFEINLRVPDQTISVLADIENAEGEEVETEFDIKLSGVNIDSSSLKFNSDIYPSKIEVYKGKTTVEFG